MGDMSPMTSGSAPPAAGEQPAVVEAVRRERGEEAAELLGAELVDLQHGGLGDRSQQSWWCVLRAEEREGAGGDVGELDRVHRARVALGAREEPRQQRVVRQPEAAERVHRSRDVAHVELVGLLGERGAHHADERRLARAHERAAVEHARQLARAQRRHAARDVGAIREARARRERVGELPVAASRPKRPIATIAAAASLSRSAGRFTSYARSTARSERSVLKRGGIRACSPSCASAEPLARPPSGAQAVSSGR